MAINFRVFGEKGRIKPSLVEKNIDVVIGCETHLDPYIRDSEFLTHI